MNILILSSGTRNKLVEYFKNSENIDRVIATDLSENAPALYSADAYYLAPKMTDPSYLDFVLSVCKKENIKGVLPLFEEELLFIAERRNVFLENNVFPIISEYEKIKLCKDKYALNSFLEKEGIPAVKTYLANDFEMKEKDEKGVFIKPRYGAGSVNTFLVHSKKLLDAIIEESSEELIIQPKADGEEYGVDVYVDFISKKPVRCFVKKKLRMRSGETEKSVSVVSKDIADFAMNAVYKTGLLGPVDLDIFVENGSCRVLEINPRFGGGYPHAQECGMDVPSLIANNINGIESKEGFTYKDGVVAMKYSEIVIRNR